MAFFHLHIASRKYSANEALPFQDNKATLQTTAATVGQLFF
jgi:hypothetical protein